MTTPTKIALSILIILGILLALKKCHSRSSILDDLFVESDLIAEINDAESPEERTRLINKLEDMPENIIPFPFRWLGIHAVRSPGGWDETGFDHRRTATPRDIELLSGTAYGVSDIENGGLHQFFGNGTGAMAPEMVEWFERAGLPESAEILKKAMKVFGEPFPRSQETRIKVLERYEGQSREKYDPFYELDGPFYDSMSQGGKTFDDYADRWLRKTCGIQSLHTELPPVD